MREGHRYIDTGRKREKKIQGYKARDIQHTMKQRERLSWKEQDSGSQKVSVHRSYFRHPLTGLVQKIAFASNLRRGNFFPKNGKIIFHKKMQKIKD